MKHKLTRDDFCIICFASSYIFAMMHIHNIWFKVISHYTRRVTYPWKNTTPTLWYLRGKCPLWLIWPIVIYWKAFLVGSRHILVSFYVCETTRCASDDLLERAKLHQIFTPPPLRGQELLQWNFISVCTLKQHIGDTPGDLTNRQSKFF